MKKILLDTNFLLIPAQFGVDIYSELDRICDFNFKIYVLDKTIDELNKISTEQKGKLKRDVKMTLQMIEEKILKDDIRIIETKIDKNVDELILMYSSYIVATEDIALQRRLKAKDIPIISMRQKKILQFKR